MLIPLISEVKGIINISYEQEDRRLFCEMCRPLEGYNVLTFTNPLNTTTVTKGGERGQVLKNKLLPTIITHCGKTDPNGFAVSNTYDPAGNIKTLTYPGNLTVTYTYDNLNRLKTVTDWLGRTASYTYDNAGRLTSLVQFNGTVVTYGYDNANRMTSLDNTTSSGTAIAVYAYTLDNNGNRTGISQTVPLTMNAAATNIPFSYNSQGGRLLSAGSNNFTYDNEGQLSSGYSNNYTFDYNHRLTGIGTNYQFSYDGTGNRLKAVRYGITTKYIYDLNGNLLADTDVNNNILHYYVYGAGLLEMVDSTGAYCYHFDATGNTVAMTNSSQNIANAYTNDPFGNILDQQETDPQPFKYVGQYGVTAEANGFCYMRARYYDPQVGRFASEDPQGFDGGDVNLYLYAGGNPIMLIDPYGLSDRSVI